MDVSKIRLDKIKNSLVFCLVVTYLILSFLPNDEITFGAIGLILLSLFTLCNFVKIKEIFLYFFVAYLIMFLVSKSFWLPGYDTKDIISSLLFFSLIPSLFHSLSHSYENTILLGITTFWFFLCFTICFWGLESGIDFQRSTIFNIPYLHKNGVATFIEMGYVVTLFSGKNKKIISKFFIFMLCSISLLFVGSKTAILLVTFISLFSAERLSSLFFLVPRLLITFLLLLFLFIEQIYEVLVNVENLYTASLRFVLWDKALSDVLVSYISFIFGIGPGNFEVSELKIGGLELIDSPHNYILSILNSYGLLGLVVFGVYFLYIFSLSKQKNILNTYFFLAYMLFFLHSLFDVGWVKGSGFFIAMITGLMFIKNEKNIIHQ